MNASKGSTGQFMSFVVMGVTIFFLLVVVSLMTGKMGVMNETEFGNNSNATGTLNTTWSFLGLTASVSNLMVIAGLFIAGLVAVIAMINGLGKKRR